MRRKIKLDKRTIKPRNIKSGKKYIKTNEKLRSGKKKVNHAI